MTVLNHDGNSMVNLNLCDGNIALDHSGTQRLRGVRVRVQQFVF